MHASIDVGTNTVRLLIGEVHAGSVSPRHYGRQVTRLGGGFHQDKGLAPVAMERTLLALEEFSRELVEQDARPVRVVGTEILRRATNASDFLNLVRSRTGLQVDVISGDDEARLTALGALSVLSAVREPLLVVDVGGGSTEFALVRRGVVLWTRSYPLGVVRLFEDYPDAQPRSDAIRLQVGLAYKDVCGQFSQNELPGLHLVGTAGTVTTLAALKLQMVRYDWRLISNLRLDLSDLKELACSLYGLTSKQRLALPGMEKGREDVILPGLDIFQTLLEVFSLKSLTVSAFGLLEGLLIEAAKARV